MQMYLISVARLREGQAPVSLSRLAEALGISPVSANEMCHKLQEGGWLAYQPYKGVTLTPEGERRALYVMRRHRL
jgi:DtxR family Mn-dependent transcriptional regulator